MTQPAIRRFRVPEGRTLTLPFDLCPGPGLTNVRIETGGEVDLEVTRCDRQSHFVNMALRHGDLVELDAAAAPNPDAPKPISVQRATAGDLAISTGMPAAKE